MVDTAANFSGSMPEHYDRIMGPALFDPFAQDLARRLPAKPPGGVLEIACGTGLVTRHVRERLDPSIALVATDISDAMLSYARGKVAGAIDWRIADAAKLPFDDAAFGAVVCAFGIMFVPDKKAALREARRVLKPGGVLLFNVWDGVENNPHGKATAEVMEGMFPGDPEMRFSAPYAFNNQPALGAMLAEAGFGKVRMEQVPIKVGCASARDFSVGQLKGTPRGALLQKRGVDVESVIGKAAAALARVGGETPFRVTAQALVVEAQAA